ncbi:unnamed protein product [Parascedosporium putredinis]|uniref:lytic cellulose monooxygenase (C4-dehydrogenating) n=1 Tax=Parascedosporium putredinis TaxID=1442378 RepID=A0A9P1H9M8_9PEZI|nr:unnamed protein product [Parascedosporium putredinis]CAI8001138.1 unnamed protein product [Parascedosporium putredinis]
MTRSRTIPTGLASLLLLAARVNAHGIADGLAVYPGGAAGGTYYLGYNPSFQYQTPPPEIGEWSTPDNLQAFRYTASTYTQRVTPQKRLRRPRRLRLPDIICHLGATPGAAAIPVNAGDDLGIHWDTWPDSHKGPIVDSLANCEGPCQNVDKTKLKFFDISREAVIDAASDLWAPNVLVKNDLTWFVRIPEGIAPGNYVLRHEIVALHAAGQTNGAQSYPFCFNLAISSKGTDKPEGRTFEGYYTSSEVGIVWDLFGKSPADYKIPGPADNLYTAAEKATQRKPSITATGTFVKSLDPASIPQETSAAAPEEPTTAEAPPAESTTSEAVAEPTTAAPTTAVTTTARQSPEPTSTQNAAGGAIVYSTVYVTHQVTVTQVESTTIYATVTLPRP